MATHYSVDEAEIRQLIDSLVQAIRAADLEGLSRFTLQTWCHSTWDRRFSTSERRQNGKNWIEAFTMFQHPLGYEVRDLAITISGDVAFAHSLNLLSGTMRNGARGGDWVRATYCFRKVDGNWIIAHDHISAPLDPASGRALVNLEP